MRSVSVSHTGRSIAGTDVGTGHAGALARGPAWPSCSLLSPHTRPPPQRLPRLPRLPTLKPHRRASIKLPWRQAVRPMRSSNGAARQRGFSAWWPRHRPMTMRTTCWDFHTAGRSRMDDAFASYGHDLQLSPDHPGAHE